MPRHNFSPKVKREARARSGGFCEAVGAVYGLEPGQRCNAPLAGKRVEIDHYPIPATDEGSDVLENAVACCVKCHAHKTATYDVPMQAKGKRIADRHLGLRKQSEWNSRGFEKRPPQRTASRPIIKRNNLRKAKV
jgi:5-methylcytosine-specific restriction protein A